MEQPANNEQKFELELHYDLSTTRTESFPLESSNEMTVLAGAWADFWKIFINSICWPRQVLERDELPVFDAPSKSSRNEFILSLKPQFPRGWFVSPMHPDELAALISRPRQSTARSRSIDGPVPSTEFASRVTHTPIVVPRDHFAVAIGENMNEAGQLTHDVILHATLLPFTAYEGSLRTVGIVVLAFFGTTILPALTTQALSRWQPSEMIEEHFARVQIEQKLMHLNWRCQVKGEFRYNRESLVRHFEERLGSSSPAAVCELQGALAALGYSPGAIDGVYGPHTEAAAKTFAIRWKLPTNVVRTPLFNSTLAKALTGTLPPSP